LTINISNNLGQSNISVNVTTNSTDGFNYSFTPDYIGVYDMIISFSGDKDYNQSIFGKQIYHHLRSIQYLKMLVLMVVIVVLLVGK
jgi:hypothetical protein